ncbi:ABC transporter ATP-binding protein, partial [Streptomyces sp. SID11385]|nr:ABC transporter ATP-binding protein [Streptomyces sp. SID11385]
PEDAASLRAALLDADGRTVRLRTHRLQHAATELLLWARAENIELDGLDIRAASLEEAFLRIAAQAGSRPEAPVAPLPAPALAEETTR